MHGYLGIDVGSVSTNFVLLGEDGIVKHSLYLRTRGKPIQAVQQGLKMMKLALPPHITISGVGTTGSGRHLAGVITGADIVKNEITTHAIAASNVVPGVQTILEIGGQDSKMIILRHGVVAGFAMNTVCAAGTGSFLDQQAARLNIGIEEFGDLALKAKTPVQIAGRCAVFAESDMIHKQQLGYTVEDILAGLCDALVRNYLNNVGKGKEILEPVLFQGGVAVNPGMRRAFEKALGLEVVVPPYYNVMGALGAAMLAREATSRSGSGFRGFQVAESDFNVGGFACDGCSNACEVVEITESEHVVARWGDRCGRWCVDLESQRPEEKIS